MRKLLVIGLMIGSLFAANAGVRVGNTGGRVNSGFDFIQMDVQTQLAPTSSALVWYADNIAGYASIDFYGVEVSTGSVPTTISAQAMYANGLPVSIAAQIITSGTDLTDIKSSHYKFTLPAASVTRNVSFNFLIAD